MDDPMLNKSLSNDTVLQKISKKFISLQQEKVKKNNERLQRVISNLIARMKEVDTVFSKTYMTIFFGGSFYKGTKISKPTEFDLDIIIRLPYKSKHITFFPGPPGFTKILVEPNGLNYSRFERQEIKVLNTFITNGYINQENFRRWIERVLTKVITALPRVNGAHVLQLSANEKYSIQIKKSGPAFTLWLQIPNEDTLCVDLVPALDFNTTLPHKQNQQRLSERICTTWLAIPKPLNTEYYGSDKDLYWRFSFYYQEREILSTYGRVKLIIRLLKKLRDTQQWKSLASYYIETFILHEVEVLQEDVDKIPLTLFFFRMLEKLLLACSTHTITYYWDMECNLLERVGQAEMFCIAHRLQNIIKEIKKNIAHDPYIIAKYILNASEYRVLKAEALESSYVYEPATEQINEPQWCAIV